MGTDHAFTNQDPAIQAVVQYEMQVYLSPQDGVGNNAAISWQIGNGDPVLRPGYSNGIVSGLLQGFLNNSQANVQSVGSGWSLGNYVNTWLVPNPNFSRNTRFFMYTGTRTYQSPTAANSSQIGTCEPINWYVFDLPILVPNADLQKLNGTIFKTNKANFTSSVTTTGLPTIIATGCWPSSFV